MHNRRHGSHREHRNESRKRVQDQESDILFPKQNYYRPGPNDQANYEQQQYGQFGYGQDFSTGISGGSSHNQEGSTERDNEYPNYRTGSFNRSDYSQPFPQSNRFSTSSIGGSYQQDNAYQGSSMWRPQSTDDKDSTYGWGYSHKSNKDSEKSFRPQRNHFGKGPKGFKRSDERIREDVSEALFNDHDVDASDIEVKVQNGEVTLSGTIESRIMKRQAEDCVEHISGVIDIRNELRVQSQPTAEVDTAKKASGKKLM